MAKYCPQCNAELPDDALFCTACGAPVGDGGAGPQGGSDGSDGGDYDYGDGGNNNKRQLYILLGVVGVLAVLVAAVWGYSVYSEKREARLAREKFVRDSIESVRRDSLAAVQAAERRRQDSIEWERSRIDRIKAAYKAKIRECDNIGNGYFLHDISGDDIPELWIQVGSFGYEMGMDIYVYEDEKLKSIGGYTVGEYHAGKHYVLEVSSDFGGYYWHKFTYDGNELKVKEVYSESNREFINGEWIYKEIEYKEPTEPEIDYIQPTNLAPIDRM